MKQQNNFPTIIKNIFKNIGKEKNLMIGVIILIILYSFAIFPSLIANFDPNAMSSKEALMAPSLSHFLGTDNFGRDIFSRIVYGARIDLLIAMGTVVFSLIIGIPLGLFAGYYGGILDTVIMRFLDAVLAFPPLMFAILAIAFLGTNSFVLILSIGVIFIPIFTRLVRASTMGIKNLDYIQASKISGAGDMTIMFKTILPNIMGPVLVQISLTLAITLLVSAALNFLGLGIQPPTPTWGSILRESQSYMNAIWFVLSPGICIFLAVLAFNLVGDGIRDIIDPKMKLR